MQELNLLTQHNINSRCWIGVVAILWTKLICGNFDMRFFCRISFAVALVMSLGVHAQSFRESVDAYKRGDYRTALAGFRVLAEQGNPSSQYNLGMMYVNGHGVVQSDREAVNWFRMAAVQGVAGAQYNLGVMYASGQGVPQRLYAVLCGT